MVRTAARTVRLTALTVAALTMLGLAGCSPPATEPSSPPTAASPESSPSSSPSATPSASPIDNDDAAAAAAADTVARESLAASIASGNTAALASWVTDPVQVTIAASEFSELLSPYEATAQAGYVVDLAATWDFALPEATIDLYRAGFYTAYFPEDVLVGLSSTGAVIAFTMSGAEASAIFMCIDEALLF